MPIDGIWNLRGKFSTHYLLHIIIIITIRLLIRKNSDTIVKSITAMNQSVASYSKIALAAMLKLSNIVRSLCNYVST